jgi:ribosomal protein S27AE
MSSLARSRPEVDSLAREISLGADAEAPNESYEANNDKGSRARTATTGAVADGFVLKRGLIMSRRNCPVCGASMYYKPTLLARFADVHRRVCSKCSYTDPKKVIFFGPR